MKPACMTDEEWAGWTAANADLRTRNRAETPCRDCPMEFHLAQRAAGTCDGYPLHTNGRQRLPVSVQLERRREQWRAYRARRMARGRAAA